MYCIGSIDETNKKKKKKQGNKMQAWGPKQSTEGGKKKII